MSSFSQITKLSIDGIYVASHSTISNAQHLQRAQIASIRPGRPGPSPIWMGDLARIYVPENPQTKTKQKEKKTTR